MEIERITLEQYLNLEEKSIYDFALKFVLKFNIPENVFNCNPISDMKFGFVKTMQAKILSEHTIYDEIEFVKECTDRNPLKMFLDDYSRQLIYLVKELEGLSEREINLLTTEPTQKEINAGLHRFDGLGLYLQERELAGKDITKLDSIREMKYQDCFVELYTRKQERDFETAYSKLK